MKSHPSSPSSSPSSSSSSSSSSSLHSTISTQSLSSASSAASATAAAAASRRCQGLDLLVKAVYHVAGSVIGVPYIQRRVLRRRKPALRFDNLLIFPDSRLPDDRFHDQLSVPTKQGKRLIDQDLNLKPRKIIKRKRRSSKN